MYFQQGHLLEDRNLGLVIIYLPELSQKQLMKLYVLYMEANSEPVTK